MFFFYVFLIGDFDGLCVAIVGLIMRWSRGGEFVFRHRALNIGEMREGVVSRVGADGRHQRSRRGGMGGGRGWGGGGGGGRLACFKSLYLLTLREDRGGERGVELGCEERENFWRWLYLFDGNASFTLAYNL